MTRFMTTWLDYCLPTGHEFAVAVCGYSGKIQQMLLGDDSKLRQVLTSVEVGNKWCEAGENCLVLSCRFNKTEPEQFTQMLGVITNEQLDKEAAEMWQTENTVEALVKFAEKMNEALPEHFRLMQKYIPKSK